MTTSQTAYEIHVHGDVPLRADVGFAQIEEALKPLWKYAGAKNLTRGSRSHYEEEPGIAVDSKTNILHVCWTVEGRDDFRQALDELCLGLNEISSAGAPLEISFYDMDFDEDEADEEEDSHDDFFVIFVGPTTGDIMKVQRDLLVQDVVHVMERHFEANDLEGVVGQIDALFDKRFNDMVGQLDISRIMRGPGGGSGGPGGAGGHGGHGGGGRKPRHLH